MKSYLLIFLLFFTTQLFAQDGSSLNNMSKYYFSIEYGKTNDNGEDPANSTLVKEGDSSLGFATGYYFFSQTSFGLLYKSFGDLTQVGTVSGTTVNSMISAKIAGLQFRTLVFNFVSLNIGYGKVSGELSGTSSADISGGGFFYGLGVDFTITSSIDFYGDYTIYSWSTDSSDLSLRDISLGIRIRFNSLFSEN